MEQEKIDALVKAAEQVYRAFGAPGDWGYNTPKGDALFALCRALANFPRTDKAA